jgi:O-acetyl-ADP-ribose deacetylase (regulator of RNase III)
MATLIRAVKADITTLDADAVVNARITRGYRLAAPWIIHTVGPIWKGGAR